MPQDFCSRRAERSAIITSESDMLVERRKQRLYASHHQFHVEDRDLYGDTGDPSFWTQEAVRDLLAVVDGTIGIGTGTYGHVEVTTELHDSEPSLNLTMWDHVAEASLNIRSGRLRVIGCLDADDAGEVFEVEPGRYRVRCCHANLAEADDAGDGGDWYVVQIWASADATRLVLKRWFDAT